MSDEKTTPVMDVVPPPQGVATVVEAPAEQPETLQISDEIAEQIAADATAPPAPAASTVETYEQSSGTSSMSTPPAEEGDQAPGAGDSPSDLIQSEINTEAATPVPAALAVPKAHNPARAAVIATVFITLALAGLAVFAYISTQN